jgi:hypothetical protein
LLTHCAHDAPMFGPSIKTVFASRWRALWFAASVMLTAYCSIPEAEKSPEDAAADQAQVDATIKALEIGANAVK